MQLLLGHLSWPGSGSPVLLLHGKYQHNLPGIPCLVNTCLPSILCSLSPLHNCSGLILPLTAAPVRFLRELQAQEVDEGATAHLCCELSRADVSVEWRKGTLQLFPCAKYQLAQEGTAAKLLVRGVEQEDAGDYTCDAGPTSSTASLVVRGEQHLPLSPQGVGGCPAWQLARALSTPLWLPSPQAQVQDTAAECGGRGRW